MTVAYFGCLDVAGHYLHTSDDRGVVLTRGYESVGPWNARNLDDTKLWPPQGCAEREGIVSLHYMKGWTLLCMFDRSINTRPGSHAIFLAEGGHSESEMWALAREHFPRVAERLRLAFTEATPK